MSAHPRSRGENSLILTGSAGGCGSSPLTRGKPDNAVALVTTNRLIPAHAGKTNCDKKSRIIRRAHPRSRGENFLSSDLLVVCHGSSPLTRGKRKGYCYDVRHSRLIPAHAGKTSKRAAQRRGDGAHPRSRGENAGGRPIRRPAPRLIPAHAGKTNCLRGRSVRSPGSSPLTRGKRGAEARPPGGHRLIPAHAGKTLPDLRFYCADRSDLGNP